MTPAVSSRPMLPFATPEWVTALKYAINASPTYRDAARAWEGDFWFIVDPVDGRPEHERRLMYLDLWHGECRDAFLAASEDERSPEFRIWAPARNWQRVITREIDPIRALMTNQLRLKGNLAKIMRNVRAAQELVLCAADVPTDFTSS